MAITFMNVNVKLQERSDYAELVERLQQEVEQLRSQLKMQRQQLVADDTKLCAALTDKVCL